MKHLVLYDGQCGFCNKAVLFILSRDKEALFGFAPLQGQTAKKYVPERVKLIPDTLILIENFQEESPQIFTESKAVFRIGKELGGVYKAIGSLQALPSIAFDPFYRLIARHRHKLFGPAACLIPDLRYESRFLP